MAFTGVTHQYISSNKYNAVAKWARNTAYNVGDVVRPPGFSLGITITIANPAVFTWTDTAGGAQNHGLAAGDLVVFKNNGDTLPAPLAFDTTYYVISGGLTVSAFELATTPAGTAINTTGGSQSGTHKAEALGSLLARCQVCVIAGTSSNTTDPSWQNTASTRGQKTTDNTVTWQEFTGHAPGNGDLTNTPNWTQQKNINCSIGHVIKSNDGQITLIVDTAGTAGNGAEPSWSTTLGGTTVDNGVTWRTLKISGNKFANWAAPHHNLLISQTTNWGDTSKTFYLGNNHSNITAAKGTNWTVRGSQTAPVKYICIDEAGSMPPVAADVTTGAKEGTGGNFQYIIGGSIELCHGLEIYGGDSGNNAIRLHTGTNGEDCYYRQCKFILRSTGSAFWTFSNSSSSYTTLDNCQFRPNGTAATLSGSGFIEIFGNEVFGPLFDLATNGITPANAIFSLNDGNGTYYNLRGVDLSNLPNSLAIAKGANNFYNGFQMTDCKIPSGMTNATLFDLSAVTSNLNAFVAVRCANSGGETQMRMELVGGTVDATTIVARSGGASDNGVAFGWNVQTTTRSLQGPDRFRPPTMSVYNTVTAADRTVTLYGVANMAAMPTDQQVWLEIGYLGASGSPLGSTAVTRAANPLTAATSLTADTSSWDGGATARGNATVYAAGDVIKLASNPGRIFFCTVGGTSAGSEPGGYASAVDGDTITDNTATFRAGWRFKIAKTLNAPQPQKVGNIWVNAIVAVISSQVYFDPKPVLS